MHSLLPTPSEKIERERPVGGGKRGRCLRLTTHIVGIVGRMQQKTEEMGEKNSDELKSRRSPFNEPEKPIQRFPEKSRGKRRLDERRATWDEQEKKS